MSEETYKVLPKVSRVEVIDDSGRVFVGRFVPGAFLQLQDDERTLKVFVSTSKEHGDV